MTGVGAGLRVVQATAWYGPHHLGGTEIFLEGLVQGLRQRGVESRILTPRVTDGLRNYVHQATEVETYAPRAKAGGAASLEDFAQRLRDSGARLYHQHTWTPDCGLAHLKLARSVGLATVLTVHVPSYSCMRGTMVRFGREPCDGKVREALCAACWAQGRGAPEAVARLASLIPAPVGQALAGAPSKLGTALSGRRLARERANDVADMIASADRVVTVCRWLYDAMVLNDAPADRLSLSRQGVGEDFLADLRTAPVALPRHSPLKVLYVGRFDPVKGPDTLVRALRQKPELDIQLTLQGPHGGLDEQAYRAELEGLIGGDRRISLAGPAARRELAARMAQFDVLAVPSLWLETGPLVVLEAQAAGLFVLGSDRGGIAELVHARGGGRLVPAGDVGAWALALAELAAAPPSRAPQVVRTMDDAAQDMAELYSGLV